MEGFGKSCQLVTGPGNEIVSFPGPLNLQPCHWLGSLAFILHLPGPALLSVGPTATPTAVPFPLEPGRSVGTARRGWRSLAGVLGLPIGAGTPSCLPGFLRKICSLEVLRQPSRGGIDAEGQWLGRERGG